MPSITIDQAAVALNRYHIVMDPMIHQTVKKGIELENYLRPVVCDHTYTAASAEVSDVLQAYQCDFTPNNDIEFTAIDNTLQRMKIDIVFECDQLDEFYDSWRVEWVEDGRERNQWTFPRYVYDNFILPKLVENLDFVSVNGVYQAPTAGEAGLTVNACDGIKVKVQAAVNSGLTTPIPTGQLTDNNIVNQVEGFCDALPRPYKNMPGVVLMSQTNADKYWRNYRDQFGTGNGNMGNENNGLRIDNTRKRVVGIGSLDGFDGMIFIPNSVASAILGRKRGQPYLPQIRWQVFERKLKGLAEFSRFYGFKYWGHIFVNDQW